MSRVLLATRNRKKLAELRRILDASVRDVELVGLDDVPAYAESPESGLTFEANALLKAREGAAATALPTVADDSGLAVDALNGMPGVFSARWAGRHGDDQANNGLLLAQLADVPDGHTRTNAELTPEEKDAISHRGQAFRALAAIVAREVAT